MLIRGLKIRLAESRRDLFDDGQIEDIIWHGLDLIGLNDMTDQEILAEYNSIYMEE